ncbi:MAG: transcriptional regulator, partial [Clostridium sp.]
MLINYIQQALGLFEKADAVLICDKDGYIEYAKWYKNWYFKSGEVIGMHILEVYPTLTEESSTILRCTRTGESRIDDE